MSLLKSAIHELIAREGAGAETAAPDVIPDELRDTGTPVFWAMGNDPADVSRFLSAIDSGIAPVVVPPGLPAEKLDAIRRSYGWSHYFDGSAMQPPLCPESRLLSEEGDLCFGLMTSGSTGVPKVLVTTAERLEAGVRSIHQAQSLQACRTTGIMLPLFYSFAIVNQLFWSVLFGRDRRYLGLPGDPASFKRLSEAPEVDMICLVATQVRFLQMMRARGLPEMPDVKVVNFAGAPFPLASIDILSECFPNAVFYNNYGCAEAMPRLTVSRVDAAEKDVTRVGRPISGARLRIEGEDRIGAIAFRADYAALGALRPDGSIERFESWITPGDLGRIENGVLHVMGRSDQLVKINGERISLVEIEGALQSVGFSQAAAWVDQSNFDQRVIAVCSGPERLERTSVMNGLRGKLQRNVWPGQIFWTDDWPFLESGKSDRLSLQERWKGGNLEKL